MPSGYSTVAWQRVRQVALSRARHRCQHPGCRRTTSLIVHHLDGRGPGGPRGYDPTNLRVLCRSHHTVAHEDLRPWPPREG